MRHPEKRTLPLAIAAILGTSIAFAAPPMQVLKRGEIAPPSPEQIAAERDPGKLVLTVGIFDPLEQQLSHPLLAGRTVSGGRYAVVQFKADARFVASELTKRGLRVVGFVPNRAFVVEASAEHRAQLANDPAIRFVGDWRADYKIADGVLDDAGDVELTVLLFRGAQADAVRALAASRRMAVLLDRESAGQITLRLRVPREAAAEAVAELALQEAVQWIERYRMPHPMNHNAVGPIQANMASGGVPPTAAASPLWQRGILGSGQIVAVADSGLDRNEGWFNRYNNGITLNTEITDAANTMPPTPGPVWPNRKVFGYWVMPGATAYDNNATCGSASTSYHGTHTSGSVAGDAGTASTPTAANYQSGEGMAPNAQLLFQDIGHDTSGCLSGEGGVPMWQQASAVGAKISSNSYGSDYSGAYTASDAEVDQTLWQDDDMLIVFSAGNDGSGARTIGHPGHSKHALTVGALGANTSNSMSNSVIWFSSRGPTSDGRRKPDIMAPGVGIVSARGNTNNTNPPSDPNQATTQTMDGTSMATPITAGGAALARQYFEDGFYPTGTSTLPDARSPLGAELKAVLLNGTAFIGGAPDNNYGWGRVWLDNNLFFPGDARKLRSFAKRQDVGIAQGETDEYTVQVAAGQEFRATLTWYDPPAAPGLAGRALINDLDLEVVAGANTYKGNVFSGAQSATGGSADTINPVEQVRLTSPTAGTYTIRVRGTQVPGDGSPYSERQGYALAVSAGGSASAVSAAPATVSAANVAGEITVTASAVGGATGYQLYRADGTCTQANALDFQLVEHGNGPALIDALTQGGYTYAYKVRGVDANGEGPISACAEVVSTSVCSLLPQFDQTSVTATQPYPGECTTRIGWDAGQSQCPAALSLRYNVYRSTDPLFTPSAATLIAQGVGGGQYLDDTALPLTTYYYVVRAEDTTTAGTGPSGGNESPGTHRVKATPSSGSAPGTFSDGADSPSFMALQSPWSLTDAQASSGSFSYRNTPHGASSYTPDTCAAITTPPIALQSGAMLSFKARYQMESNWDGVVMEISTDGGTTWNDLPPTGGYPGNFSQTGNPPINACGYVASHGAFNGTSNGNFNTFTRSLSSYAGQTVRLRWRMSTDPGYEEEGFYLDEVQITSASAPAACSVETSYLFGDGFE